MNKRFPADALYAGLVGSAAACILAVAGLIFYETLQGSVPALREFGPRFVLDTVWDPVAERFGALPYIYGTLVTSGIAILLALPAGLGSAVFLSEIAGHRLGAALSFVMELLAAIPSIVYGIWGFFILAPILREGIGPWLIAHFGFLPLFRGFPFGIGILNAGIVLAIMIVPTIISISREVLLATPQSLREAALALGATRAEAIAVTVDAARPGILGATILALGRALGETMAVTMVIGNTNQITGSILSPGATMASVIANEFTEATGKLYLSALIEIALVLFVLTFVVNALARALVYWATGARREAAAAA